MATPSLAPIVKAENIDLDNQTLYTCLSCSIAFLSAEEQRVHYRSDHHRYNMKRRVASLPPVSAQTFNQKVLDRRAETAIMLSPKGSTCQTCNKVYTSEGAYQSHMASKKHRENEVKAALKRKNDEAEAASAPVEEVEQPIAEEEKEEAKDAVPDLPQASTSQIQDDEEDEEEEDEEEAINQTIDQKIAAARSRLSSTNCLFCSHSAASLADNLTHMSSAHSFFIPDADYLVDLPGLITYLGEKIAVGNVCLYCNGKGREFRTIDAVRKHMLSKGHCKIAYDSERERLEVSDYYDFSSSYPDAALQKRKSKKKRITAPEKKELDSAIAAAEEEWEDVDDDDEDADEIVDASESEEESESESESDSDESVPENQITYGDSHLELVLPSGARLGHRSLKRYYDQSFRGAIRRKPEDPNSGAALVRRLVADKNSALVPVKGDYGAYGRGTEVVKARNRGEAREAGRHIREFRDVQRREQFKTKMGFVGNNQKHFRDPLLQ